MKSEHKNCVKKLFVIGIASAMLFSFFTAGCSDNSGDTGNSDTKAESTEMKDNSTENIPDIPETPASSFKYQDNGEGEILILNFIGEETEVNIPSEIEGKKVITIGGFMDCSSVKTVIIPDSVMYIGNNAFMNCTGLTSIIIPDGIKSIGENAFSGCTGLNDVTIPGSVSTNCHNAFENCTGLTNVTISDGVKTIGEGMFLNCTGLTSIDIPDSVTRIGKNAFSGCTGLKSIKIPDNLDYLGIDAIPENDEIKKDYNESLLNGRSDAVAFQNACYIYYTQIRSGQLNERTLDKFYEDVTLPDDVELPDPDPSGSELREYADKARIKDAMMYSGIYDQYKDSLSDLGTDGKGHIYYKDDEKHKSELIDLVLTEDTTMQELGMSLEPD